MAKSSAAILSDSRLCRGRRRSPTRPLVIPIRGGDLCDIVTNRKDTVIVIPKSIILSRQRGKTVFIVDRGVASERVIETGLENITEVEVTKGLVKNERVVTSGFETLSNKSKVKIVK